MNTRIIMIASSVFMGAAGLLLSFLPQEILAYFSENSNEQITIFFQLLGAIYFAFAFLNWTAKGSILGGIYGRSIVIGNFTHFMIGALTLLKGFSAFNDIIVMWVVTGLYVVFASMFGLIMFTHPLKEDKSN